jgi:acyltransferase
MRIKNIDLTKGALILLVIAGHVIIGPISETLPRYIIYSFQMPLFCALSGYLLRWDQLKGSSFIVLMQKYRYRMIIPWVTALLMYAILANLSAGLQPLQFLTTFATDLIKPFFHLWFIAGLLSWILLSRALLRIGLTMNQLLIFSFFLSAICQRFRESSGNAVADVLLFDFRPYFYFFFVLGGAIRQKKLLIPTGILIPLAVLLFIADILLFFYPHPWSSYILYFVLNIVLILLTQRFMESPAALSNRFLEWIGVNSLGIYLWHVLPIVLAYGLHANTNLMFYSITLSGEVVVFGLIFLLARSKFAGKYLLGIHPSPAQIPPTTQPQPAQLKYHA